MSEGLLVSVGSGEQREHGVPFRTSEQPAGDG